MVSVRCRFTLPWPAVDWYPPVVQKICQPRLVVVAKRDPLAEPAVTWALAGSGVTGGRALLLIEAAILARNMLKFELLVIVFGTLEEPA